ncbi:Rossmann-like and DUF2520 domain-containing protein [Kribbella deserti]|uniref:Rossmann-like and DUF2520 domain-containing protein n=1 Tax=Kribbella deserti TaxID=1926257 RepID=A0ABV6QQN7_9ACTN
MESIGIIGAGRAGTAVGQALTAAGYRLTGITARTPASAERAARLLPGIAVRPLEELAATSDVLLLAVPDEAIATVAAQLDLRPGQYVVHLSGAHGTTPLAAAGGVPVALHPPMTFPRTTGTAAPELTAVTFTATAPDEARPFVERLVKDLGAEVQWVPEDQRAAYHAGVVHGANHLVTLLAQSFEALRAAGITDPSATMRPLLQATLDNALRSGHDALTGPVARGDAGTVEAHLAALPPDTVPAYVALARATVELVAADGRIDASAAQRLRAVLPATTDELPATNGTATAANGMANAMTAASTAGGTATLAANPGREAAR